MESVQESSGRRKLGKLILTTELLAYLLGLKGRILRIEQTADQSIQGRFSLFLEFPQQSDFVDVGEGYVLPVYSLPHVSELGQESQHEILARVQTVSTLLHE